MKREVVEKIANAMKVVEKALADLDNAIMEVQDDAERNLMRDTLYKTVHFFHAHNSVPVAKHYPDLHPDVPGSTKY